MAVIPVQSPHFLNSLLAVLGRNSHLRSKDALQIGVTLWAGGLEAEQGGPAEVTPPNPR